MKITLFTLLHMEVNYTTSQDNSQAVFQSIHFLNLRSNSDLSGIAALPNRPETSGSKDWKPGMPEAPQEAPMSPTVKRSSSFSKVFSSVSIM